MQRFPLRGESSRYGSPRRAIARSAHAWHSINSDSSMNTCALKRRQVSSRSRHRRAVQSSIPAPHGHYSIDRNRPKLFQRLAEPIEPPSAIRGIRRRIPHAGGRPLRFRHAPPVFRAHMRASCPATDIVAAFRRSELLSMTSRPGPRSRRKFLRCLTPNSPATYRAPSRVKWPTKGAMRRRTILSTSDSRL